MVVVKGARAKAAVRVAVLILGLVTAAVSVAVCFDAAKAVRRLVEAAVRLDGVVAGLAERHAAPACYKAARARLQP